MTYLRGPAKDRLENLSIPEPNSGCWLFFGSETPDGYGRFFYKGKRKLAHRASHEIYCGPIPEGNQVLHKCDNPACVNPEHLFLGSHADNMRDMVAKNRHAKRNRAVLDFERIQEIRRLASEGWLHRKIADKFGVTRATISHVVIKRTWSSS